MCNCKSMCWIPGQITDNGRWPMPNHHPNCEDFKQKRYIRLFDDEGNSFIDFAEKMYEFMSSMEFKEGNFKQEDVYLTVDQFNKLDEHTGF